MNNMTDKLRTTFRARPAADDTQAVPMRRNLLRMGLAASALIAAPTMSMAQVRRGDVKLRSGALLRHQDVQVLFADLQTSRITDSSTVSAAALGRSSAALAKVANILRLPMLFSVVPERSGDPVLIPALQPFATAANTLERKLAGPFMDRPTAAKLAANGRKTLIVAGFAAEVVVLQAVLDAVKEGYEVQYVADAIGGLSARTEASALRQAELAGAVPTSVVSLVARLTPDFFHSPGSETFAAIGPLL